MMPITESGKREGYSPMNIKRENAAITE